MKRKILRTVDYVSIFGFMLLAWTALPNLISTSIWFKPGDTIVTSIKFGEHPMVTYDREIMRNTLISYSVVVRDLRSNSLKCEAKSEPFLYIKNPHRIKTYRMDEWAPHDKRCWELKPGDYIMHTCWTLRNLVFGWVGDKIVCRHSNPFKVEEVE